MHRPLHLSLVLLIIGLAAGCGSAGTTVSYDASENQTTVQSQTMTVVQEASGSGYGSSSSIVMRAVSQCPGENCTPNQATLSFSLQGRSDIAFSNRTLTITADGEEFAWRNADQWNSVDDIQTSQGQIVEVTLPLSDLEQIATATSLSGSLGGRSLDLNRVQSQLQDFVSSAQNPAAASGDA